MEPVIQFKGLGNNISIFLLNYRIRVEGLNQIPNPNKKIDDFVGEREGDVFYGWLDWETGSTLPPKPDPHLPAKLSSLARTENGKK